MKLLIVSCLVTVCLARPEPGNHGTDDDNDRFAIGACFTENWQNTDSMFKCIRCFHEVKDYESQDGLESAKACVSKYLPLENTACKSELDALNAEKAETGEAVIECMVGWQYVALSTFCIEQSQSTEAVEKLTDGSMCIIQGLKNVTKLSDLVHQNDVNRQPKKIQTNGKSLKDYIFHNLLPKAACEAANENDQASIDGCKQCFASVNRDNFRTNGFECINNFLMPYYQDCDESVKGLDESAPEDEQKDAWKCFIRGIVKSVVMRISPNSALATPENLLATFELGHEFVIDWVQINARPEYAKKIIQHLENES